MSSNMLIMIGKILHCLFLLLPIKTRLCMYFFNCRKCGQLPHNHIKCDLGVPNCSCATIVIPFLGKNLRYLHIQTKVVRVKLQTSRTYEFTYIHIFKFISPESSYWEISKFAIDSTG